MTQPPGQQPPQGGFGAPYDPVPGSYGPPTRPPAQAAGPYGTQPPGPYGPPPQPYGQQIPGGYGHPQPQPQPPGGPGRGGRSKGKPAAVVAAALAVCLIVGGGIWFATSGGDGDGKKPVAGNSDDAKPPSPSPSDDEDKGKAAVDHDTAEKLNAGRRSGEAKVLWIQKNGVDLPRNGADAYGPWIVGDIVVKAMYRTVSGYSAVDGARKWSLRLPSDVCAAPTRPTADGRIVIGIERGTASDAPCESLQMIDLTTGRAGWHKSYERPGLWDGLSDVSMAINGDVLTVGRTSRTDAYRVHDGKVLWGRLPGNCQPFGFASGPLAIAAASCQTAADDHKEQLVERIDPVSGKVLWKYKVKKGWQVDQFYSVSPLVVSLRKGETNWAIAVLNSDGTYRSQLAGGTDDYEPRCGGDLLTRGKNVDNCLGVAADANTFYMATKPKYVDTDMTNAVVAFDLDTGKSKWKVAAPAGQTVMPLRVEGGKALIYMDATKGKGGGIMSLAPTGGALQPVLRHPASAAEVERGFSIPRVAYVNGRSLLMHAFVSADTDEEEIALKTMISFGG
ncbi:MULTISPECIES: PQQ-binding-like beta-propeller repeat protein [unclassified Streptomyces]|uniref:outer membrane protein assembly factor BamB family protein n=1 Tax=unclassified Streptomyces TaxID=2593676 RepID=UPI00381193E7